ncbi:MAG: radical SAM protein [Alphaproteobacteria bacterium]|nr:radical SAM protein [Alphaproteobacteria bacterium]
MIGCQQKYLKPETVLDLFTPEEVDDARRHGKLLSMELELTNACNAACKYCYRFAAEGPQPPSPDELTLEQIEGAVRLAHSKHGLRSICILGGEPLIPSVRKKYIGLLEVCNELGIRHLTVTNGLFLTEQTVQTLHDLKASVCVKLNGMTPETHDSLVGVKGAHNKSMEGFNRLISLGYGRGNKEYQLAFETVIVRDNYDQIEDMWVWARDRGIIPYVETLTDQGRGAKHMKELQVGNEDLRKLFERINEVDREKYGFDWDITPPIVGGHCSRLYTGLYVQATGTVCPCAGVDMHLGNLQKQTVSEILSSPLAKVTRNIGDHITGKCRECDLSGTCYGCRGAAYQAGDLFGEDPVCWRDVGK